MNYSIYLLMAAAMGGRKEADTDTDAAPNIELDKVLEPAVQQVRQVFEDFRSRPVTPQTTFDLERQLAAVSRELCRLGIEWALNQAEPMPVDLPPHVEFEAGLYTRLNRKTPQEIATTFGKIRLERVGYRPTDKTGDPTIFPLAGQLGIVAGASPALAERAAYYQAEAGATQRRTLERLKQDHGVDWGVKKLREVVERVAEAMAAERHEVQAAKLRHWLEQAWTGKGKHKPVLSVGRDGISFGAPVKGGTIFEVASAGTITVLDRRGKRVGTVYLARTPESKQGTMSGQLTRLVEDVLREWQHPLPRLCYVTDAGDNETAYYETVLKRMRHPRTAEKLEWTRVVDFYHASERVWKMADALFGSGPAAKGWARRMLKLLKKPNGVRRVLNSASVLRGRHAMKPTAAAAFDKAYNYLRDRTRFMHYAAYQRIGIPRGSGVTEAACKTIYTQRLKLSGMRWKKAGAQTILNLRVLLLSQVWSESYQRVLEKVENVKVPTYDIPNWKPLKMAA
jgi:hypothetical protein